MATARNHLGIAPPLARHLRCQHAGLEDLAEADPLLARSRALVRPASKRTREDTASCSPPRLRPRCERPSTGPERACSGRRPSVSTDDGSRSLPPANALPAADRDRLVHRDADLRGPRTDLGGRRLRRRRHPRARAALACAPVRPCTARRAEDRGRDPRYIPLVPQLASQLREQKRATPLPIPPTTCSHRSSYAAWAPQR
jgi:hypothetical protein